MSTQTQNEYLLLFRGDEWYKGLSPEELQNVMSQCKAWFDQLTPGRLACWWPGATSRVTRPRLFLQQRIEPGDTEVMIGRQRVG